MQRRRVRSRHPPPLLLHQGELFARRQRPLARTLALLRRRCLLPCLRGLPPLLHLQQLVREGYAAMRIVGGPPRGVAGAPGIARLFGANFGPRERNVDGALLVHALVCGVFAAELLEEEAPRPEASGVRTRFC